MNDQTNLRRVLRIASPGENDREYTLDERRARTVLDALEIIRATAAPDLLYRHSCHHGSCGTCGMLVNGERKLACLTTLEEAGEEIELRPLAPFPTIRDLAVDPTPLFDEFPKDASYLRPSEAHPGAKSPPDLDGYTRLEDCIECGLCESACPISATFTGPAALAAYHREIEKNPVRRDALLREIDRTDGVWGCQRHIQCSIVCPNGVAPARRIVSLKKMIKTD